MSLMQKIESQSDALDTTETHNARVLIPNGVKAEIDLDGQVYTLRITRAGKLILTK